MVFHRAALAAVLAILSRREQRKQIKHKPGGFHDMYYTDYHNHSILSFDGEIPLPIMAEHMVKAGIHEMCITDHWDLLDEHGQRQYDYDWAPAIAQFDETAAQFEGRLKMKLGLEFGMGHLDPPVSDRIMAQPRLDFVIGSVHNFSPEQGCGDIFVADHSTSESCAATLEDYFFSMEKLVKTPYYDVLGHIIYPLRYMGNNASILSWMDHVEVLLKEVIQSGRGIEVNTNRARQIKEWIPVLKLYKQLGGEILTLGSDAHEPIHAGLGIPETCELLKSLGFNAICTYEKHKPTFVDI